MILHCEWSCRRMTQPGKKNHKMGISASANRFANGSNQNCGNFITDRPTSRVLAPLGGKSSGSLW